MAAFLQLADLTAPLECRELVGEERLGEAFLLEALVLSPEPIETAQVLGNPASLTLRSRHGERTVAGIVTRWTVIATSAASAARRYRLALRPRLALLELRRRSRVYQHLSVPDIVQKVLEEGGYRAGEVERRLGEDHVEREYVVQYEETDAVFVRRLCEEEGIFLRLFTRDGAERVALEDRSAGAESPLGAALPLIQQAGQGAALDMEGPCLFDARAARRRRPGKVLLRDYDPDRPALDLSAQRELGAAAEREAAVYEAPGRFKDPGEGDTRARVRLESLRADALVVSFATTALALAPGDALEVEPVAASARAPQPEGAHVVVAVRHRHVVDASAGDAGDAQARHVVEIDAIPKDTPFRLKPVTPRPRIAGVQSAFTTGAPDSEVHPDTMGRVYTQFHWDIDGASDHTSSLPVRAMQPNTPGSMLLPRVGWEVFVVFEDGDPERPFVLGRSYNGKMLPPFSLPANKTMTSFATDSSPGGRGRNLITFDDAKGREHLNIQATFGKSTTVSEAMVAQTAKNERFSLTGSHTMTIGASEKVSVAQARFESLGSLNVTVGAFQTVKVGGDFGIGVGTSFVGVGAALIEQAGNPVKGAVNLAVSKALSWVGSKGTAGAVGAAALGIAKAGVEGYLQGGEAGAAKAVKGAGIGVLAGMVPGGEAVLAHINGATQPNPWDHGKPQGGAPAPGGGAGGGASDSAAAGGPGPGHRTVHARGGAIELVGGFAVVTPGQIGWTTLGASAVFTAGSKTTRALSASFRTAGVSVDVVGSKAVTASGKISRKSLVRASSTISGALTAEGAMIAIKAAKVTIKVGGALTMTGSTVLFQCPGATLMAGPAGVWLEAGRIEFTGAYEQSGTMSHR